jgi:hypothetical protein
MQKIQSAVSKLKPFHPLADIFPLMMGAEFDELVTSIKLNGLREPIVLFEDKILDGRNRARASAAAGVEPRFTPFAGGDPTAFVIDKNIRRRHLTQEQKREFIDQLLQANPERSDRQIAELIKADHKTVATVRKEKEGRGEIPHVEVRIDAAGRKQPARKVRTGRRRRRARQDRARGKRVRDFRCEPSRSPDDENAREQSTKEPLPPDVDYGNALIGAWDTASDEERRKFVLERKIEITRVQEQTKGVAFDTPDDGLEIPDSLRRIPKEPVPEYCLQSICETNQAIGKNQK